MKKDGTESRENPVKSALEEILKQGAQQLLQQAVQAEVDQYLATYADTRDSVGRRMVTRNGHLPARELQTGLGHIQLEQPRVRDRRQGQSFSSGIVPKYKRKIPSLEALIPELYLKGVSSGDFGDALKAILGEEAKGLSPDTVARLKKGWKQEYKEWRRRSFEGKRYVYFWADAIYFTVRMSPDRPCMLVIMGAIEDGTKELVALEDGVRESTLSWKSLLEDLKRRGLAVVPELAIGDGALGFWKALEEEFPGCRHQRCWVHKTANILDKLPKSVQITAKREIHDIYQAPKLEDAVEAFEAFLKRYQVKYPKACDCLCKDKDVLLTFYRFPAEHWGHIRSTNVIESTFATVRHRTRQTRNCCSRESTLTMAFKMGLEAEKGWRRLNSPKLLGSIVRGVKFRDGEEVKELEKVA